MPSVGGTVPHYDHVLRMRGASLFRIAVRRSRQAVRDILKNLVFGSMNSVRSCSIRPTAGFSRMWRTGWAFRLIG